MLFSENEVNIISNLFLAINKNKHEIYTLKFYDGSIIEACVETCYETDNNKEIDDIQYEEYHAVAMKITNIIKDLEKKYAIGDLIEINYHNYPKEIYTSKGIKI